MAAILLKKPSVMEVWGAKSMMGKMRVAKKWASRWAFRKGWLPSIYKVPARCGGRLLLGEVACLTVFVDAGICGVLI